MSDFIPAGVIHEIQISDKEMYAFEPVLCDAIYNHKREISDLRKRLAYHLSIPTLLVCWLVFSLWKDKLLFWKIFLNN